MTPWVIMLDDAAVAVEQLLVRLGLDVDEARRDDQAAASMRCLALALASMPARRDARDAVAAMPTSP